MLALKDFAAAVLGGFGSPVGGVVVGLAEALTAGCMSSAYKDAAAFLIILLVLFFLPRGLMGTASVERV
jgi:branched-chain amino acid transport system permease protein